MCQVEFPLGKKLNVLTFRAKKHNFATWEKEYVEEVIRTVKPSDTVYCIGVENGETEALVATMCKNVHLFEPSTPIWANIKSLWKMNDLPVPFTFHGFASDKTSEKVRVGRVWGSECDSDLQEESNFYTIWERPEIQNIRLDDYASLTQFKPDIILCDVEGAELLVLRGAEKTLRENDVKVFVSLHPESFMEHYGTTHEQFYDFAESVGYSVKHIGTDHEIHLLLSKNR